MPPGQNKEYIRKRSNEDKRDIIFYKIEVGFIFPALKQAQGAGLDLTQCPPFSGDLYSS